MSESSSQERLVMALPINFLEAHFFGLPSQSNVYGLTKLCMAGGANKLLVASLRRQVYSLEYIKAYGQNLIPSSKEVHFTYIPSGAEIISIDAFNKSQYSNDFVVGITFLKNTETQANNQYFNIYFDWEPGSDFNLDTFAQSCHSIELPFIPYQLYHTEIIRNLSREVVWLLSGSDNQIHLYREDKLQHKYIKLEVHELFPELCKLPSIVLAMDIIHFDDNNKHMTAVGCEDGFVYVALVDSIKKEIIEKWSIYHDGPITSVKFFTLTFQMDCPDYLQPACEDSTEEGSDYGNTDIPEFHLLITNSIEPSVIYRNVMQEGLRDQQILPLSDKFDCVLCSCVADVDMDGINEIILGTYGQELLIYKYFNHNNSDSSGSTDYSRSACEFSLHYQRSFSHPLQALDYVDITGDGLKELVILSTKGIHILQHNLEEVADLCEKRLKQIVESVRKNDTFRELQVEDF